MYIGWGSHCDFGPFTGWIMALRRQDANPETPMVRNNKLWRRRRVDGRHRISRGRRGKHLLRYRQWNFRCREVGLPIRGFHRQDGHGDWQSAGRPPAIAFGVKDYFTPEDQDISTRVTTDLGSEGVVLLPPQPGTSNQLLVRAGKRAPFSWRTATAWAHTIPPTNNNLQTLNLTVGGIYGAPAYWNSTLYFWGVMDYLKAFSITNGMLSREPVDSGSVVIGYPPRRRPYRPTAMPMASCGASTPARYSSGGRRSCAPLTPRASAANLRQQPKPGAR